MTRSAEVWQRPYFARRWSGFVLLCITERNFSHLLREPGAGITGNLKKKCIFVLPRSDKVIRLIYIFAKDSFGNFAEIVLCAFLQSDRYEILLSSHFFKCTTLWKTLQRSVTIPNKCTCYTFCQNYVQFAFEITRIISFEVILRYSLYLPTVATVVKHSFAGNT